jgi:branched-subunit amino acid ABC-type transport system permease component
VATYVNQILAGIAEGGWLFLVASGLSLVFGALRIVNFAHGSLYMLGAYLVISLEHAFGTGDGAFVLSVVLAGVVVAAIGAAGEMLILRRIYSRPQLTQLIVTFALVLVVAGALRVVYGSEIESTPEPPMFQGHVTIIGRPFPIYSFFLMALAALVGVSLWALVYRTPLGRIIRGAVSDPTLLRLSGINVRWLFTAVFAIGALLAGIAGAVTTPPSSATIGIDVQVIVKAFAVVVIGGLGSLTGAVLGALLVGLADSLGLLWWSNGALAFPYIVLVAVLVVRPFGLFRTATA